MGGHEPYMSAVYLRLVRSKFTLYCTQRSFLSCCQISCKNVIL